MAFPSTATQSLQILKEIEGTLTVNLAPTVLVASTSQPGMWHTTLPLESRCSCRGNAVRGRCSHVRLGLVALEMDRVSATPDPSTCSRCHIRLTEFRRGKDLCCICELAVERETSALVTLTVSQ